MNSRKPPRWQGTFEQFRRTLSLLEEALDLAATRELTELEKGGLIKRFENAWELGWKTLADFLIEREDPQLSRSPGSAVRLARGAGLIEDGDAWLNAGKLRNVFGPRIQLGGAGRRHDPDPTKVPAVAAGPARAYEQELMRTANLTQQQHDAILQALAPFADKVERVDIYGSRARGDHHPGSDVDLIVSGHVDLETLLAMRVALDESWLSIFADVQRYSDRLDPAFAANVSRDAKLLFTRGDLLAARTARAA